MTQNISLPITALIVNILMHFIYWCFSSAMCKMQYIMYKLPFLSFPTSHVFSAAHVWSQLTPIASRLPELYLVMTSAIKTTKLW